MPNSIPFHRILLASLAAAALATVPARAADSPALAQLLAGNARYVAGHPGHPHQDSARRAELAGGQKPFAVILGCSDSRTAPEILFDQGLGDLFVIRLAGNVVDDDALASIEFAVSKLGARCILVLGHEKCGAVSAAVEAAKTGAPAPGHLGGIISSIRPAVDASKGQPGDAVDNAVRENVREVAAKLSASDPVLAPLVKSGELQIAGARYDLDDGKVELLTQ